MIRRHFETALLVIPAVTVPMGTAWFVYRSMANNLGAPAWLAMATAAGLEVFALASVRNVLTLRGYNVNRRKTDPAAPTWAALAMVTVYSLVVVAITYLLDPSVSWALLLWPLLSLAVMGNEALRQDHAARLAAIAQDKAERRAMRQDAAHNAPMRSKMRRNAGVTCPLCGVELANQQAQAAHMRWKHAPQPEPHNGNGHHAQEVEQ